MYVASVRCTVDYEFVELNENERGPHHRATYLLDGPFFRRRPRLGNRTERILGRYFDVISVKEEHPWC
jgi:hypothetical protein